MAKNMAAFDPIAIANATARCLLFLLGFGIAVFACSTSAHAMDTFCPAVVQFMRSPGTAEMPMDPKRPNVDNDVQPEGSPSDSFIYELASGRMNTIQAASMLADTDHGWFQWIVQEVGMHEVLKVDDTLHRSVTRIQSPTLSVEFPLAVMVRHAWVISAKRLDGLAATPNTVSDYTCLPPAYGGRGNISDAQVVRGESYDSSNASPNPAPKPDTDVAVARPIATPYSMDCKDPVKVLVGNNDNLIDVAIYHSSGRTDVDRAALSAANASGFTSAVAYCQKVPSASVFWSEFSPR